MNSWVRSRLLLKSFDSLLSQTRFARAPSISVRLFSSEQRSKQQSNGGVARNARRNDARSRELSKQNYDLQMANFAKQIGYKLEELPSLLTVFTTKRFVQMFPSLETNYQCNDRLSTLGRTVMLMYVQDHLYNVYPDLLSDELGDVSSAITNDEVKKNLCKHLDIVNIIRSPYKIYNLSSQAVVDVLSDVVLAIVGALYCDKGAQAARKFVEKFIVPELDQVDMNMLIKLEHPKQMLCYILKEQNKPSPVSQLLQKIDRDKDGTKKRTIFVVGVFSGDELLAEGSSPFLAKAEEIAIKTALTECFDMELKEAPKPSLQDNYQSEDMINFYETDSSSQKDLLAKM